MVNIKKMVDSMSLIQKASLMSGKDHWRTRSIKDFSIPSLFLSDGPHGLRKQAGDSDHLGLNPSLKSTCYPTAATIVNSWDENLIEKMGEYLGKEANFHGVNMILGPGLNIKRNPLCGRNFEYFSEDPLLSGKLAASLIRGIQSQGVIACPKHFAVNNQEYKRMVSDSVVDERTLREIYLTGFEVAIKEGKAKAIMSSYNKVNGIYANENAHLLQKILKDEWKFEGIVVTDWGGSNDHVLGVKNGSHLEMPSTGKVGIKEIVKAVENGTLDENVLNLRVEEYLNVILSDDFVKSSNYIPEVFDINNHHEFARKIARESFVLLKNANNVLPLLTKNRLAVIGHFAEFPRYQGAGSSLVNPTKVESFIDVLNMQSDYKYQFAKGYERNKETQINLVNEAVQISNESDVIILFIGLDELSEVEGKDREHLLMPINQLDLIEELIKTDKPIIVVLSAGSIIEMPWINKVSGVLHTFLSGQAGALATLDILSGKFNPSGKLAETYPFVYDDVPNRNYFPALSNTALYKESIYVGYRYYETFGKEVRFPFGFGLSYTEFRVDDVSLKDKVVEFRISNIGNFEGSEVIQLYITRKDNSNIFRSKNTLVGFKKIHLDCNESTVVSIEISEDAFRYFDVVRDEFCVEKGMYMISLGNSIKNSFWTTDIYIDKTLKYPLIESNQIEQFRKDMLIEYFNGSIKEISNHQFDNLMINTIRNINVEDNCIHYNSTFSELKNSKSIIGKLIYKILNELKLKSEKKGKPDLNLLFIFHMPFRNLSKMTSGAINMEMVDNLLLIFNGKNIRGIFRLIISSIKHKFEKKYILKD